jgi:rhodanese-related sulfurtransferase
MTSLLRSSRRAFRRASLCPGAVLAAWALALGTLSIAPAAEAAAPAAVAEEIAAYFDIADAHGGVITAAQIPEADYPRIHWLDVRPAAEFAAGHVPGAVNIEWRKVFAQRARLPRDRTIVAYCNTSSFAAQVAMALRMDGFENVRVLYAGYNGWKAAGGVQANALAAKQR